MKKTLILPVAFALLNLSACDNDDDFNGSACFEIANEGDITVKDTVQFSNCSKGASYYLWEFGDGETSMEEEPSHIYDSAGTYTVGLTVQNKAFSDINADGVIDSYDNLEGESAYTESSITVTDSK